MNDQCSATSEDSLLEARPGKTPPAVIGAGREDAPEESPSFTAGVPHGIMGGVAPTLFTEPEVAWTPERPEDFRRLLEMLPHFLEPSDQKKKEAKIGVLTVVGSCAGLATVTAIAVLVPENTPPDFSAVMLALIGSEVFAAFLCLFGLLYRDPGVVRRSIETIDNMPPAILARVQHRLPADDVGNVKDSTGTQSFCVRCFVWRPSDAHHCRICQRCVVDFDHHCNVFGRCIAGRTRRQPAANGTAYAKRRCCTGNIPFFYGIVACGWSGLLTAIVAVVVSVAHNVDLSQTEAIIAIAAVVLFFCCACRHYFRWLLRSCLILIIHGRG